MAFPTYTIADLFDTTGRSAASYVNPGFLPQAIKQATMLFILGTNRSEPPVHGLELELMKLGILYMADAIALSQPNAEALATPFSSESIGSYSYNKVQGAVMNGLPTGISWFDQAVRQLAVGQELDIVTGGFEVFEDAAHFRAGHLGLNQRIVMPHQLEAEYGDYWVVEPTHGIYDTPVPTGNTALQDGEPPQVSGAVAQSDVTIVQGADTELKYRYLAGEPAVAVDLSGYTARAQFRASRGGELWLTLVTGAGIVLDDQGYVTLSIPHGITEGAEWDQRSAGVWDLELTGSGGAVERFLEGSVVVSHDVTR